MLKLNKGDAAKRCFMEALSLDVKCYEAFDQLVTGEMMTPDEGMSLAKRCSKFGTNKGRMGIRAGPIVQSTISAGRRIHTIDLHSKTSQVQAWNRTCSHSTAPRGRLPSW